MAEFIASNPTSFILFALGLVLTITLFLSVMFAPQLPFGEFTNQLRNSNNNTQIFLGVAAVVCFVAGLFFL